MENDSIKMKEQRETIINKWKNSGLLDDLKGYPLRENIAQLYESSTHQYIPFVGGNSPDFPEMNKTYIIENENFDCLIGDENSPEITDDEFEMLKDFCKENNKNRTPEQKIKINLLGLYYNLEDSINLKAIEYSSSIPSLTEDEKKSIKEDYIEGAKYVLKEMKKIINNI